MNKSNRNDTILKQPIAANTIVTIAPWALHNSRGHWGPDAHEFRPERWIEKDTTEPNET